MKITFSKFGKKGRLGNQLFQLASMIGFAEKYRAELCLPRWDYQKYFANKYHADATNTLCSTVTEAVYHYTPEYYDAAIKGRACVNLDGYFQSEKYWRDSEHLVRKHLEFKHDYKASVIDKYSLALKKPCVAVSIRRGDFVGNKNYYQIPITYYTNAIKQYDSQDVNFIFFSDDMGYCKLHFGCMENAYFADRKTIGGYFQEDIYAIEQLCLMTLCQKFIISNSTFSWWGAYLSGSKEIIRPKQCMSGSLAVRNNEKDFYPAEWQIGNENKIDLSDVTFMIPVAYDHSDRKQNLELNVCMLQKHFNTNIIVMEQNGSIFKYMNTYCNYTQFEKPVFHRTRMLNLMAQTCSTPIIANWDADVFISPQQILEAVKKIRKQDAEVVYPYDGRFARVDRKQWFKKLEKELDIGVFSNQEFKGMRPKDKTSVGGAIFFDRKKYLECGGENENFISYGPEDVERFVRFSVLAKVERINGALYHMDHFRGLDSRCATNPHDKQNHDELAKVQTMTKEELMIYVKNYSINNAY